MLKNPMLSLDVEVTTRFLVRPTERLWPGKLKAWEALAQEASEAALRQAGQISLLESPLPISLYVCFDGDRSVQELNKTWRNIDAPTNVLSFEAEPGVWRAMEADGPKRPMHLGDIILGYETIAEEAKAQAKTLEAHTQHLIVHGVLHLLGYDHQDDETAHIMESLERAALAHLGVADPYAHGPIGHA
jgi:probable rRNA maturation factor